MSNDVVIGAHGSGGTMMKKIIDEVFFDAYASSELMTGDDAAVLESLEVGPGERIAMSTDSFVVYPQFFKGGDLGRLAVCGTVNDVSTSGAKIKALSSAFILEEGYPIENLKRIARSMAEVAKEAGVPIVTGDTKVVEHGHGDGCYINTTGVGIVPAGLHLSGRNLQPGDAVLLSGTLGDHGIAIMSEREDLSVCADVASDAAPLNHLIQAVIAACPHVRAFRDPTRGGIASTLNEFAEASSVDIVIDEDEVPVKPQVKGACELLGYDVYHVANEGKMVCVVPADEAEAALAAMKSAPYGTDAAIIGEVREGDGHVFVRTAFGTERILDMLVGELLPRIC